MSFDGVFLRQWVRLMQPYIGSRINRVQQFGDSFFVLHLWTNGTNEPWLVCLDPAHVYVTFLHQSMDVIEQASHWSLLLKKHIEGTAIQSIQTVGIDRIIDVTLVKTNELFDRLEKHLIIEMTGRVTNLILTQANYTILDAWHRVPPHELMQRTIHPGAVYKAPPVPPKLDPFTTTITAPVSPMDQFLGISQNLHLEILHRIKNGESMPAIMQQIQRSETIYMHEAEFHFIPLTHLAKPPITLPWKTGLETIFELRINQENEQKLRHPLSQLIRKEMAKLTHKLELLEGDLKSAQESRQYQTFGELLFAYAMQLPKGSKEAFVLDEATQEHVHIPLDPTLDIASNALKYFKRYQKGQKAKPLIEQQKDLTTQTVAYFQQLEWQVQEGDARVLQEIHEELIAQGYLKLAKKPTTSKKKSKGWNGLTFITPQNLTISVGRNNMQNEALTFEKAHYTDIFFHVQNYPGSHVVLHHPNPDSQSLMMAAQLAAYFSPARLSSKVAVNYAPIKTIKKIPGGKPGMVRLSNYQTLIVKPETFPNNQQ